jgi:hypothetical protein
MPPHSPHRASWGQDNGHHDFNSVSAIHPSARMAWPSTAPSPLSWATQHVIANVGFIGFALFLRVFHPTVGVQAIDSLTWESTDLTIAGTQQRPWPVKKRVRPTPVRTGPYRRSHCAKLRKRRQIFNYQYGKFSRDMVAAVCRGRQWLRPRRTAASFRHSPDGAQPRDNRRRRCQPTRGNETLCPRVVRSTRCDRWAVSYAPGVFGCPYSLKSAGQRRSGV